MATRSITTIKSRWTSTDSEWKTHARIYRHWDGYPEEHGKLLYNFLNGLSVINGIPSNPPPRFANGPGRLAAQLVVAMAEKNVNPDILAHDIIYMDMGQEYEYIILVEFGESGGEVHLEVLNGPTTSFGTGGENCTQKLFEGTVDEFGLFLQSLS